MYNVKANVKAKSQHKMMSNPFCGFSYLACIGEIIYTVE